MDKLRFPLLAIVALLGFLLFQAWQADQQQTTAGGIDQPPAVAEQAAPAPDAGPTGAAGMDELPTGADQSAPTDQQAARERAAAGAKAKTAGSVSPDQLIQVVTDTFRIAINTQGGSLYRVTLRQVPVSSEKPESELTLIRPGKDVFFQHKTRVLSEAVERTKPRAFKTKKSVYRLADGDKRLTVPLVWEGPDGRTIVKTYVFRPGSYRIDLNTSVKNGAEQQWSVSNYIRYWRYGGVKQANAWFIPSTFTGVGWYEAVEDGTAYSFFKRQFAALGKKPVNLVQNAGWTAVLEHYFIAAAIPDQDTTVRLFARPEATDAAPNAFVTGFRTAGINLASGETAEFNTRLFIGPKLQDQMTATAASLDLTVDYGFMAILARPIFNLLSFLHSLVGNWGVAIILLTVLIKLGLYWFSEKQYRAMARMRRFQPRIQQLKEQYGDDRQQMQAKMMELYKQEGFNPLAGCWPMLIQAPIFIVLYWVILQSAELRSAPFLWINDLSAPDPYYILPIIFGVTMYFQQKLTMTAAMDPIQQRMLQFMPIGLAIFFTFFPAGLVLYWCTNNILSIAQQWYIYRKLDAEGLGHKAPNG